MKLKFHLIVFLGIGLLLASLVITILVYLKQVTPVSPISSPSNFAPVEMSSTNPANNEIIPLTAVLPHHDVVKTQRQAMLAQLSTQAQPATIILLSPNHFDSGNNDIITSTQEWTVKNGQTTISPDTAIINDLLQQQLVTEEPGVFTYEHGIKNLLGEIHQYFPEAKLVPLIFKSTTSVTEIEQLVTALQATCSRCGVLASVDMSHYQPSAIANIHDLKTLRALYNLDTAASQQVEVDSNASLTFLLDWAKQTQQQKFTLWAHTNSSTLAHDPEAESTSHIMGYYSAGDVTPAEPSITFTFAGDGMFGREIGYQFQEDNFVELFSTLGNRTFWGTDISWINLEGPVSDESIIQDRQPDDLVFNFSRETISALKYLKLTVVSLGNNHTYNQGQAGLDTTRRLLNDAGIAHHGHPTQVAPDEAIYHYAQGDLSVAMIALNVLSDTTGITELIQQEHEAGNYVIVLPHWGNEYQLVHSPAQEKLAQVWFAAGADLIIGAHPHVIQDAQIIDDKLVLYSLGNFVFDQTFSQDTQQGLLVTGSLTSEELSIILAPLVSTRLKPALARGDQKQTIIERVCANITEYCQDGVIKLPIK